MPTNTSLTYSSALISAWTQVSSRIFTFLPNLIAAIAVFVIGWIIAGWIKSLTIKLLETFLLSKLLQGTGVNKFLKKADVTPKVEEAAGTIVKWLIILVFFIASVNILGLTTVSRVLENILGYVPNVISAALILTIGVLIAGFVEKLVKGAVASVDVKTGRLFGKVASYTIVVFSALAAISELKIAESFINTIFTGFIAMLALGLGLAIGLGGKDLVSRVLNEWYDRFQEEMHS